MRHLYVLTIVILVCTSKPWKINKCVKRINFAEREPKPELKGSDTEEEFDEEFFTTHMSLLSMSYTGKEEHENIEELGSAWGMDELGAVGGIEEMEEVENVWSSESEDEYIRTSRDSRKKIELKEFEEYAKAYEDFIGETEIEREKYEYQEEQFSVLHDYNKPYKRSTHIDKKVLEHFVESVNRSNALLPTVSASLIQEYLSAGINGEDRISKLNEEYPLNRSKKIDFKNLRSPFGTEVKCLKDLDEEQLNDALFFDDFFACSLDNFLKETKVGKFSLAEACMLYKVGTIRFIPCSLELLKYLSSVFPLFDIDDFLYDKMGTYLGRSHGFFFIFADKKIPLIQKNTIKDKNLLEKMKTIKTNRELTFGEKQTLRNIFYNANTNVSRMNKLIKLYESRISKIEEDLGTLVHFFPVNKRHIHRNDLIIVSMHYILSFCVHLIKPLYDKAQRNMLIEHKKFYYVSSYLNYLINHLEMLEFNSELCNIFSTLYPEFGKYYSRLKYVEEIITIYNYLLVKLQSVVVIYDISKFLLKLYMASDLIKDYRENVFILYTKILSDTESVLRDAEKMIKELT
ncbi:KELT protein [Plasmodium ovale curtisi]|uniref:KELT protein n=1 Tax=Plasmodium ovale curtisi TaxID=864141 RepID=A0A1A8X5Q9_PLAOA|nr:KELT protein [Plasmodium ovale curtisi]